VLVHGSGHTAAVWKQTQSALSHRSLAVDLPGRAGKPGDITAMTVDEAATSVDADIQEQCDGDVVLVGHSAAGIILPSIAAMLGSRVRRLIFVAGLSAAEGALPADVFMPGRSSELARGLAEMQAEHGGRRLEEINARSASAIDSLNLSCRPMRWAGIPDALPRTFIRCLRDPIQSREVQSRLIISCGASEVVDIDSGHTPALDSPTLLASILDRIIEASEAR
jgi:pimeloyl-ACP methyl ester carboxylesterase